MLTSPGPALSTNKLTKATVRDIPLSNETIRHLGIHVPMEAMLRFPTDQGGEVFSNLEFKHQLHCLVRMREIRPDNIDSMPRAKSKR